MYYNRLTGKLVFDALNIFLISAFLRSNLVSYLKNYLLEKFIMEQLRNDIIKKSKLIKSSKSTKSLTGLTSNQSKIQKVYRVAFDTRGGCSNYEY